MEPGGNKTADRRRSGAKGRPSRDTPGAFVSDASERPLDLLELFRALAEHGVDYLVIGGVAAHFIRP